MKSMFLASTPDFISTVSISGTSNYLLVILCPDSDHGHDVTEWYTRKYILQIQN